MIRLTDEQRRLAEENMPLVGYVIARCIGFRPAPQDMEDYHQIGMVGLCKAASRYDAGRGDFATLAVPCIRNEIWMNERKRKSRNVCKTISLQAPVVNSKTGESGTIEDFVADKDDVESIFDALEWMAYIRRLPERERAIMHMRLTGMGQAEIAKKLRISQSYVSRVLSRIRAKCDRQLEGVS